MKKKISILTFFLSQNYGAVLQAYAMSRLLSGLGYDVEFINLKTHKATLKWIFPKSVRDIFLLYKYITINAFVRRYFPAVSKPIYSLKELKIMHFNADLFLVGSDQVWSLKHSENSYRAFFFDFVPNSIPKVAFAASFGESEWDISIDKTITADVKSLLQRFDYIGVREKTGVAICQNTFQVPATHVLDPTLLLKDFSELTGKVTDTDQSVLFRYFIHQNAEINTQISKISDLIIDNFHFKHWNDIRNIKYKNPASWLKMIAGASFVITDSFHVCCFSILYRKPFVVYITKKSVATRMISLMEDLGISDRIFYDYKQMEDAAAWKNPIDYERVFDKLDKMRTDSLAELQKALSILNEQN